MGFFDFLKRGKKAAVIGIEEVKAMTDQEQLQRVALGDSEFDVKWEAVGRLRDQDRLQLVAIMASDPAIAKWAVGRLTTVEHLMVVAQHSPHEEVRHEALDRAFDHDPAAVTRIMEVIRAGK